MRLRLMPIPFTSLRYAASRSNVQQAKGSPKLCGLLRAVAITVPTCSGVYVAGRPLRPLSCNSTVPPELKRLSHSRTIFWLTRNMAAMAGTVWPSCDNQIILARSTRRTWSSVFAELIVG